MIFTCTTTKSKKFHNRHRTTQGCIQVYCTWASINRSSWVCNRTPKFISLTFVLLRSYMTMWGSKKHFLLTNRSLCWRTYSIGYSNSSQTSNFLFNFCCQLFETLQVNLFSKHTLCISHSRTIATLWSKVRVFWDNITDIQNAAMHWSSGF